MRSISSPGLFTAILLAGFVLTTGVPAEVHRTPRSTTPAVHTFTIAGNEFMFDNKPYQIIAGDMHYARVPRDYWRDRLQKAKAMGLNTVTTYVFWNLHEPQPGVFDFSGQNDLAQYIREAQQEGLN